MARKPKPCKLGSLTANVLRGPRPGPPVRWYWRIRAMVDGRRATVWTGWATSGEVPDVLVGLRRDRALEAARDVQVSQGIDTIGDLMDEWVASFDTRTDYRRKTLSVYSKNANTIRRIAGNLSLDGFGAKGMVWYRDRRTRDGRASATVRSEMNTIRAAWRWALEQGLVAPALEIPAVPRVRETAPRTNRRNPTEAEALAVLEAIHPTWWLAFWVAMATGARRSEILQLTPEDIGVGDEGLAYLTLHSKGHPARRVPVVEADLVAELVALRESLQPGHPWFAARGAGDQFYRAIRAACDRAGVPRFTPHSLRRVAVDRYARRNVRVEVAADLLGHSVATMMKHYRTIRGDEKLEAIRAAGLGARPPA